MITYRLNRNPILITMVLLMSIILGMSSQGCKKSNSDDPSPPSGDITVAKINANPSAYVGQTVTITGYVVTQISDDTFWFKDESNGEIRTDFPDNNLPIIGQKAKITGKVQYDDGKLEIDVSSWEGQTSTTPPNFTFDKINDIKANPGAYLYQLVALSGTVTSKAEDDDDEFWFNDGTGELKLDFPDNGSLPTIGQSIIAVGNLTSDDGQLEVNVTYWQ